MKITVIVPSNTDEDFYNKICEGFKKKYGDETLFEKEKSDGIIGGFIAEVNGTVYDTSVHTKLEEIRRAIR